MRSQEGATKCRVGPLSNDYIRERQLSTHSGLTTTLPPRGWQIRWH